MRKEKPIVLTVIAMTFLTGCGKQEPDCAMQKNQQAREQCVDNKAPTEPRGPAILPANPKKW